MNQTFIRRFALVSALAMPLLANAADMLESPAHQPETRLQAHESVETFRQLDRDGNGSIDQEEAAVSAPVTAEFATLDANADGRVDGAEWRQYFEGNPNGEGTPNGMSAPSVPQLSDPEAAD